MGRLIALLKQETALPDRDLRKIISTAPERYKTYAIPRRNSDKKRIISQPAKEVKLLQRILTRELLSSLPVHEAAVAYRAGHSILDNAKVHAGIGPILKFDFVDFFPSITQFDWEKYCLRLPLDQDDIEVSTNIFFKREPRRRGLRLSIGAPSSPILSNILMFDIDGAIKKEIGGENIRFTRYADDITFSADRTGYLNDVEKRLRSILRKAEFPNLKINDDKTVLATRKYRRQVTGLVLTNDGAISLGRERKRNIFAAVHSAIHGDKTREGVIETIGLVAFASSIESDFVARLKKKYGEGVMELLSARAASVGEQTNE